MINKLKYKLLLLIILLSASSCNKWLDLRPEDGIIRQNFWKTKEQLQASVIGCYSSLLNPLLVQRLFEWGELRGDMVGLSINASVDAQNIIEGNILSSNKITDWAPVYQTINYCNTVLDFGPQVINSDKTLTELQLNSYLAEAHGIRALMYFYLLRTFGEVPLRLKSTSSDVSLEQLRKSSQQEVYDQIIADLKFAEQNAPLTYGNITTDKGRLTRYAIYAIEADAYLWMDDYENCITACDKIISSGQFALVQVPMITDQPAWFTTLFRNGNSQESIFEFQFDKQKLGPFYGMFVAAGSAYVGTLRVGDEVYGVDDVDPLLNKDVRGDGASYMSSTQTIGKFAGYYSGTDFKTIASTEDYTHWFVYRYSDILLLEAEAKANRLQGTDGQDALDLIQMVRDRAHALPITAEDPGPDNSNGISVYILNERAREFAFEGKRWFDVLRVAKRNNYAQLNLIIDMVSKAAPSDRQQSIINKYRDVRSHYLPINQYELQTDKALVQNPFYQ